MNFILYFDDNGKPNVTGPYDCENDRDQEARRIFLGAGGDTSDYYRLDVDNNEPSVKEYTDVELLIGKQNTIDQGRVFDDGSIATWPDDKTGQIVRYDSEGEIIGDWMPGDEGYDEAVSWFPPNGDMESDFDPDPPKFETVN